MEIEIKNGHKTYLVEVRQKKMKSMTLRYREGKYRLSAPMQLSVSDIQTWLKSLDETVWQRLKRNVKVKQGRDFVYIFGQRYDICHRPLGIKKVSLKKEQLYIYATLPEHCLEDYLRETLTSYIFERLQYFYRQGYCQILPEFKLAKLKSCYGECFYKKKLLKFSSFLIHEPQQVIDSIIIHELAHLLYPNHSKDFYTWVYAHDDLYQTSMQYLKKGGAGDDSVNE